MSKRLRCAAEPRIASSRAHDGLTNTVYGGALDNQRTGLEHDHHSDESARWTSRMSTSVRLIFSAGWSARRR